MQDGESLSVKPSNLQQMVSDVQATCTHTHVPPDDRAPIKLRLVKPLAAENVDIAHYLHVNAARWF